MMWYWLAFLAFFTAPAAPPASCVEHETPAEVFRLSTAVFTATLSHVEWVREPYVPEHPGPDRFVEAQFPPGVERVVDRKWVHLSVHRVWKGDLPARVRVHSWEVRFPNRRAGMGPEAHEVDFLPGTSYLVFATGTPDRLNTSICMRSAPTGRAAADLRWLGTPRSLPRP